MKVSRQTKEWEETLTVRVLDKELPPISSKELLQIHNKGKNPIEKKWSKGSNQYIKKAAFQNPVNTEEGAQHHQSLGK